MAVEREEPEVAGRGRWGALAFRDFRLFWAHGFLQGIARNMRDLLTFYLVFDISGSALQLGITGVFQGVPILFFGLVGGALADSANRKTLLVYTQLASFVSIVLIAFLVFADLVQVWHLWLLTSWSAAMNALGRPAQRAYLPRTVPRGHIMNAITWFGALSQGTLFVGPALAGLLIAPLGVGGAYMINAVILLLAVVATVAIRASGAQVGAPRKASLGAIWEGALFLRSRQVLLSTYLLDFGVMSVGFFRPLLPILALEVYGVGEVGLGLLASAPAAGSIMGSVVLLALGDPRRKGVIIVSSYAAYALGLVALGLSPWFWLALVALTFLGLMDVVSFTVRQALIQLASPDEFRGRAGSFSTILAGIGNSTGSAEMGALAAATGAPGALIINGFIGVGITLAAATRWRGLWRYDQSKEVASD